jgi:hypothetical protein
MNQTSFSIESNFAVSKKKKNLIRALPTLFIFIGPVLHKELGLWKSVLRLELLLKTIEISKKYYEAEN